MTYDKKYYEELKKTLKEKEAKNIGRLMVAALDFVERQQELKINFDGITQKENQSQKDIIEKHL